MIGPGEFALIAPERRAQCLLDEVNAERRAWERRSRRPGYSLTKREFAAAIQHDCQVIWVLGANMHMGLVPSVADLEDLTNAMRSIDALVEEVVR